MQYPAVNNTDLEFFSTPHCKVRNFSYRLLSLFLSGHALGLAPTGIQFHTLAAEFDGIVSAYTNIILFLSLQLAHTLRGVCHLQILIRNPSIHIRLAVKHLVTAIGLKQDHAMIALYPPVWYSWMHCLQNPFEKQKTTGADHSSAPTKSKCPPAQTTTPDCLLQHGIGTQNAKAAHRLVRRCVESYSPVKSATILAPNAGAPFITNRFSRAFIFAYFRIKSK